MKTPDYYSQDARGRAWIEVHVGDTAYGVIYRTVTLGDALDTCIVNSKRCKVFTPMQSPHVVVDKLPRDIDVQGYG